MPTYRFDEITSKRTKRFKDPETGKPRTKTMKFWQTQNPFNVDFKRKVKSVQLIHKQNEAEADAWMALPAGQYLSREERDRIHLKVEIEWYKDIEQPEAVES